MSSALAWYHSRRWLYAGLLALGVTVTSSPAGAGTPPVETAHLRYSAAPSCPSEGEFVSTLRRDTDPFQVVTENEAHLLVEVELHIAGKSASGRFQLVDRSHGTTAERELKGPDCEAVARALALMLALAMQRASEPAPPRAPSDVPLPPPEPSAPSSPPATVPAMMPAIASAPRDVAVRTTTPSNAPPQRPLVLSLDLQAALTNAVVGDALPFAAMTLQLEPTRWRFRPLVAISLRQSLPREVGVAGGEATFLWSVGALRVCPSVVVIRAFDVAPCVEAALGRLGATADGLPAARSSATLWADSGALAVARWHVSPQWFLATSAGVVVALERARFELASGALISQTPALGFRGGLGIGFETQR